MKHLTVTNVLVVIAAVVVAHYIDDTFQLSRMFGAAA